MSVIHAPYLENYFTVHYRAMRQVWSGNRVYSLSLYIYIYWG